MPIHPGQLRGALSSPSPYPSLGFRPSQTVGELSHGELVADRLAVVAQQQIGRGQNGVVPGTRAQSGQTGALAVAGRIGVDEEDLTRLSLDQQQVVDQQYLSVPVAPAFPAALTGVDVETDQDAVIEAVYGAIADDQVGELRLEAR